MQNRQLAYDYIKRSQARLKALDVLMQEESWADVVRESQEVIELALKALLRACAIDPPRIHDVSSVLLAEKNQLPKDLVSQLDSLVRISKTLRRDRELAFYGSEDLTPSEFYSKEDASAAKDDANYVVNAVAPHVPSS